jgi:hypothetical protein
MRAHLTYANVVSTLCLFIVLGGGAYAATKITGKQIKNNSVRSGDIRNGTLRAVDFRRGLLDGASVGPQGPPGAPGVQGEPGRDGAPGRDGSPRTVPISLSLDEAPFELDSVKAGPLTIGAVCTSREDEPQVQIFGVTDEGGEGTLHWVGIRTHSVDGSFVTNGDSLVNTEIRGLESRWAPDGGWAGVGLEMQYRSGSDAGSVSLHMVADDRPGDTGKCTIAGTMTVVD